MDKKDKQEILTCQICKGEKNRGDSIPAEYVRGPVLEFIKRKCPDWDSDGWICISDLNRFRAEYVEDVLEREKAELVPMASVIGQSGDYPDIVTRNVNDEFDNNISHGDRLADKIADFGGSWKFISIFVFVTIIWMLLNTVLVIVHRFDPYPFIFLNLILSCLAAIQAPVILMSQNRQAAKDRFRADHDFRTNLLAELEIRSLHDKLDYLLQHQWQNLLEIQEIQMDIMQQLNEKTTGNREQ